MTSEKKCEVPEFEIVELNKFGEGIGFIPSTTGISTPIRVPFAIPQDIVKIENLKKGIARSREIVKPSPLRQAPRCKHFGSCGGCRFQNVLYLEQLKIKEQQILSHFQPVLEKIGQVLPIKGCDEIWNYRNKMEFTFSQDLKGTKFLGLIKNLSKGRVVSLEECHLTSPWMLNVLHSVQKWWENTSIKAFSNTKGSGSLKHITLREGTRTGDRMVILTISGNPEDALDTDDLANFVAAVNDTLDFDGTNLKSIILRVQHSMPGMETNFFEILLQGKEYIRENLQIQFKEDEPTHSFSFYISPTAFFQPNTTQSEKLYELLIRMADIQSNDIVYDLFCSTGVIGILAAKLAKHVVGIDICTESINDAKKNALINDIQNITFYNSAVRNMLPEIQKNNLQPRPTIVYLSPPRTGLDPLAMCALIDAAPSKIIFFSSTPHLQVNNIVDLMPHGYRIAALQPVDLFPHTLHVINIVFMEKIS